MKYLSPLILTFIFTTFTLTFSGCNNNQDVQNPSIDCNLIMATPLREHLGHPLSSKKALSIIESFYDIQAEDIFVTTSEWKDIKDEDIAWDDQGIHYIATIRNGELIVINVSDKKKRITANKLIECVGHQPEWYRAIYGPRMERSGIDYYFELWFPSAGVISQSRGDTTRPSKLPDLTQEFAIDYIDIMLPESPDELREKSYTAYPPFNLPSNKGTAWENTLQPRQWPGNWGEVYFVEGW